MKKKNFRDEEKIFLMDTSSIGLKFIEKNEHPFKDCITYSFTHRETPVKIDLYADDVDGVFFKADNILMDGQKMDFCFDSSAVIDTFYCSSCRDGINDLLSFLNKTLSQHNKKTNNII